MILPLHIVIAIASIIYTTYTYFSPTQAKLRTIYTLTGLTVVSGTWMVIANPAHMVQSCLTGLAYIGAIFLGIVLSHRKLATEQQKNR